MVNSTLCCSFSFFKVLISWSFWALNYKNQKGELSDVNGWIDETTGSIPDPSGPWVRFLPPLSRLATGFLPVPFRPLVVSLPIPFRFEVIFLPLPFLCLCVAPSRTVPAFTVATTFSMLQSPLPTQFGSRCGSDYHFQFFWQLEQYGFRVPLSDPLSGQVFLMCS